jgi:pseudouridine synthase
MEFPIRLNHYLALKNYCSRRQADILIKQGHVKINGQVAKLGDKVNENDSVTVDDKFFKKNVAGNRVYLAYNKPKGIVSHTPEENQKSIADVFKFPKKLFPIGRLDKESHGLIILTNDGRITDKLLNPENEHDKEYVVRVDKEVTNFFVRHMTEGVKIEGYLTKKAKVKQTGSHTFRITLTEGKKHQIRRMCSAYGYTIRDLQRIRIMSIKIQNLKQGDYRELKGPELEKFLKELGLNE